MSRGTSLALSSTDCFVCARRPTVCLLHQAPISVVAAEATLHIAPATIPPQVRVHLLDDIAHLHGSAGRDGLVRCQPRCKGIYVQATQHFCLLLQGMRNSTSADDVPQALVACAAGCAAATAAGVAKKKCKKKKTDQRAGAVPSADAVTRQSAPSLLPTQTRPGAVNSADSLNSALLDAPAADGAASRCVSALLTVI